MKYRVKVIALSLDKNTVAKHNDIFDKKQLANPLDADKLVKEGYIEPVKTEEVETEEVKTEEVETEEVETEEVKTEEVETEEVETEEVDLHSMSKLDLVNYAKSKGIKVNPGKSKEKIIKQIQG